MAIELTFILTVTQMHDYYFNWCRSKYCHRSPTYT